MSDPVLTHEELAVWVGVSQAAFGSFMLVFGLRRRSKLPRFTAPMGAMWVVIGLLKMLQDVVPERILVGSSAVAAALVILWMVREWRASRARHASLPETSAPTES